LRPGDGFGAGPGECLVGVAAARPPCRQDELVARGPPRVEPVAVEDVAERPVAAAQAGAEDGVGLAAQEACLAR
jgi:hypothetical protein